MGSFLGFLWFDIKRRSPYHFPLFDLRIYHNLCFSDFDIKWFVVVLTSCVSCSACFSVSADRFSARPLTHAQYTQYPFTGQNMVKKLSYQRGGIMLSLYISLIWIENTEWSKMVFRPLHYELFKPHFYIICIKMFLSIRVLQYQKKN